MFFVDLHTCTLKMQGLHTIKSKEHKAEHKALSINHVNNEVNNLLQNNAQTTRKN